MRRVSAGLIGLTVCSVLLAGCSGATLPGAGGSPSASASVSANPKVAAACRAIAKELQAASTDLRKAVSVATTDPAKAQKIIAKRQKSLAKLAGTIDNPQVRAQLDRLVTSAQTLVDSLGAATNDTTRLPEVLGALNGLAQEVSALQATCAA